MKPSLFILIFRITTYTTNSFYWVTSVKCYVKSEILQSTHHNLKDLGWKQIWSLDSDSSSGSLVSLLTSWNLMLRFAIFVSVPYKKSFQNGFNYLKNNPEYWNTFKKEVNWQIWLPKHFVMYFKMTFCDKYQKMSLHCESGFLCSRCNKAINTLKKGQGDFS